MTSLKDKVQAILSAQKKPSVLVIGDLMVDHYIWGDASRLSPEAPVPIVNVKTESTTLGGAGNVLQNLVALGTRVSVAGVVGDDTDGLRLLDLMISESVGIDNIIKDTGRPTTVKTRVVVGSHQLVRIDREVTSVLEMEVEDELIRRLGDKIKDTDIIILSDYNKGVLSFSFSQKIIALAKKYKKKVIVDPKGLHYEKYKGAFLIKPNRKELAEAAKVEKITSIDDLQDASATIFQQTGAEYLLVTLSEEGMAIITERSTQLLPVKATEVFDVTGAGDTVIATVAYFLALGLSIEEACELANYAAAIVIRHIGSATITVGEILQELMISN